MNAWINQIFRAGEASRGGVVRRSRSSVEREASVAMLEAAVRARGFHLIEAGDQFLILCRKHMPRCASSVSDCVDRTS